MKRRPLILVIVPLLALAAIGTIILIAPIAWRYELARKDYGEAERALGVVAQMADNLRAFQNQHNRIPTDLSELQKFAPGNDLSALAAKPYEFYLNGPHVFEVRINDNFRLRIDQKYHAKLVFPPRTGEPFQPYAAAE